MLSGEPRKYSFSMQTAKTRTNAWTDLSSLTRQVIYEPHCEKTGLIAKAKALISFTVTAKLICVFVFAYAKIRFSHDAAHIWFCYAASKLL